MLHTVCWPGVGTPALTRNRQDAQKTDTGEEEEPGVCEACRPGPGGGRAGAPGREQAAQRSKLAGGGWSPWATLNLSRGTTLRGSAAELIGDEAERRG